MDHQVGWKGLDKGNLNISYQYYQRNWWLLLLGDPGQCETWLRRILHVLKSKFNGHLLHNWISAEKICLISVWSTQVFIIAMYDFTRFIRKKVQAWGHKISPGLVPAYMPMHHAWNLTSQLNCCTIKNSRSSFSRHRKLHWHRCQVGFSKTGSRNLHYLIHVANSRNLRHRLEKWESWKVEATFVALTRPKLSHRTLGSHRT